MAGKTSFSVPDERTAVRGEVRRHLVDELVRFYEDVLCHEFDPKSGRFEPLDGNAWDIRHHYAITVPALLHRLDDPLNPHRGSDDALRMCVGAGDYLASVQDRFGRFPEEGTYCSVEWPALYLARCLFRLGDAVPARSRTRWAKALEAYANYHWPKHMITGAPNHNAWKCLALYACGRALASREWTERGLWSARRLAADQSPEGYWDEPQRHHGPSIHYLGGTVRPLTMLAMDSGDAEIAAIAARARDFLIRFALPDGGTLGCIDSRTPHGVAQPDVGFSTSPTGRRLNRLVTATLHQRRLGTILEHAGSVHQAHGLAATMADSLPFWRGGPERRLPQESDGYNTRFDWGIQSGSLAREHGWAVGLSATIAEPKLRDANPAARDNQNRLDIWHKTAGLIVGGGDSHHVTLGGSDNMAAFSPPGTRADCRRNGDVVMPLIANVVVDTGFGDAGRTSLEFGIGRSNLPNWVRAMMYPLSARILETGVRNILRLEFTHALVTMTAEALGTERMSVRFDVEQNDVRSIAIQLPLVVYSGTSIRVDGRAANSRRMMGGKGLPVCDRVELSSGEDGPTVAIRPPRGWEARLRHPLIGAPGYTRALLSVQIKEPPRRFSAHYEIAL